ncbi:uncharacterized protein DMAD_02575 [Drosophila madeirensis]|uniref:Uncharacterized protein n=1 Tax=Drosophila madeirensis TaxID=30013 RepID=A0AAU9G6Y6_DROMD
MYVDERNCCKWTSSRQNLYT